MRHPKIQTFIQKKLFDGLKSFRQLERRISRLPETERGDALEIFAEAYLSTVASIKAKQIWVEENIPYSVRKQLVLPATDKGVDGLLETQLGEYHAYQVKFRTGRPPLSWTEISTFIGLADRVPYKLIFTNSNDFAKDVKSRKGLYAITGTKLDKLTPPELKSIETCLKGSVTPLERKTPRPHQKKALNDILPALTNDDRATVIMACGTGKTVVEMWTAEHRQARNTLILVPSLALLHQTLHEWVRETSCPSVAYLCVCSDPSVKTGRDEITLHSSDLDFPVTTDSTEVRRFLDTPFNGVKLVFSTYQSAGVVAKGMINSKVRSFDLGIFDEAHKTAGHCQKSFGLALDDKRLLIEKRVFFTATPRHYNVNKRDKEGNAKQVYSMDVPEVYGHRVHELNFAKAVDQDIICDYRVLISVVTTKDVNDALLKHGEVQVHGESVMARQVANQLALQQAVVQYGVKKIFTFHRTVDSAASFASENGEGVRTHIPTFKTFHVSGRMHTSERESIMREFRLTDKGLVSNARCLTEGVDIPAVDLVAFMASKRSHVDIVQAVGRAMRKAPGKKIGYIFLPLYLEQEENESLEGALKRAKFDEVWDVLEALKEQDGVLADIIRKLRIAQGNVKGFDDALFAQKVEFLAPTLELKTLRHAITIQCIEVLGGIWDYHYGRLLAYRDRFGDCNVPSGWKENPTLATWVGEQRKHRKRKRLSDERIKRLDKIGFEWDILEAVWNAQFSKLAAYQKQHGNCDVPYNSDLFRWICDQRETYQKKKISVERIRRLEEIGFDWTPFDTAWETNFAKLKTYQEQHGHCNIPRIHGLGTWIGNQRSNYKNEKLSDKRIRRLEEIGFVWDHIEATWDAQFAALKAYQKKHGHCNVPSESSALGMWVAAQRDTYRKRTLPEKEKLARRIGILSDDQVQRLNEIGFVWEPRDTAWEAQYTKLKAYQKQHGNCDVPKRYKEDPSFGQWILAQRRNYEARMLPEDERLARRLGSISDDQIRRLEEIGFVWNPYDVAWETMFAELKKFREKHGHSNIPQKSKEHPALGHWVANQRTRRRLEELSDERIERLNEINFVWELRDTTWETQFAALEAYRDQHGDCNVPSVWEENPTLGNWAATQRQKRKKGLLDDDQIQRLEDLGFEWCPNEASLEAQFTALEAYLKQHGDCNVPAAWKENPTLAGWVTGLRTKYRADELPDDQVQRLDDMGFDWSPFDTVWETRFAELKEYQKQHGGLNVPWKTVLGKWVSHQRANYKNKRFLTNEQIQRLKEIGFNWNPIDNTWETRFAELKTYRDQHEDCNVPQDSVLGFWVSNQRKRYKDRAMPKERIRRLEEIGFEWDQKEKESQILWDTRFTELKAYRKQYGDCNVPKRWEENPALGHWVIAQRRNYKNKKLSEERIQRLDGIGFRWSLGRWN